MNPLPQQVLPELHALLPLPLTDPRIQHANYSRSPDLAEAVAEGAASRSPHVVSDGEHGDSVVRNLDAALAEKYAQPTPLPQQTALPLSIDEEASSPMAPLQPDVAQSDLDGRRSSEPPNLLASWIKGVSNSMGRGTSAARFYGSSSTSPANAPPNARTPTAKELKRSVLFSLLAFL